MDCRAAGCAVGAMTRSGNPPARGKQAAPSSRGSTMQRPTASVVSRSSCRAEIVSPRGQPQIAVRFEPDRSRNPLQSFHLLGGKPSISEVQTMRQTVLCATALVAVLATTPQVSVAGSGGQ